MTSRALPSFPTRRSSDLIERALRVQPDDPVILFYLGLSLRLQEKNDEARAAIDRALANDPPAELREQIEAFRDRKSTRLNSSHGYISYAVFCLKKKTQYT